MSEFASLREAVDAVAGRRPSPDFGELERRATRRGRRRLLAVAAVTATVVVGSVLAVAGLNRHVAEPAVPAIPLPGPATNGWVALDDDHDGVYLVRPGKRAHRLAIPGSGSHTEVCPAWSPDGTRLLFGRYEGTWQHPSGTPELVIVPVSANGTAGASTVITLEDFPLPSAGNYQPLPCGSWAADGRWVAMAATDEVWVVDTQTGAIRRLRHLWPGDLAWRPGTDQLAIVNHSRPDPEGRNLSAPVTIYSVSAGDLGQLGSVRAGSISWSPDGSTLAYTGGEDDPGKLWLVGADGTHARLLDGDMGRAVHGIGPEWSPRGDRIVYQRIVAGRAEAHEVVLVNVSDGAKTVIKPPWVQAAKWYPFSVSWSPDGTTLLYAAWFEPGGRVGDEGAGVIVVPADRPRKATLLTDTLLPTSSQSNWGPSQMWGRQPG